MASLHALVRVRPRKAEETAYIQCSERVGNQLLATHDFSNLFSSVLGPSASQHDVFHVCGMPLLEAALEGRSVCLFAYGQTGSGKTFSMYGAEGGKNPAKLDGVVPAMCAELFRRKQQMEKRNDVKLNVGASLVEIQGSKVIDLLADPLPAGGQPAIRVRGSELIGERKEKVHSSRGLTHLIERGMSRRVTTQNMTHAHSSRSHAFLTLMIERKEIFLGRVVKSGISTMYMVDLAGSEKFVSGGDSSAGGGSINAGLLALGKVLTSLARGLSHVPYRDSVLTRMLSSALGGDCQTCVLACINPGLENFSETRNVLQYAHQSTAVVPKLDLRQDENKSESGNETDGSGTARLVDDPMANDAFDSNEVMDRRTELIETDSFGPVHARCLGDPDNPLLLYIHGSKGKQSSSRMWNTLTTKIAETMNEQNALRLRELEAKPKPRPKRGVAPRETSTASSRSVATEGGEYVCKPSERGEAAWEGQVKLKEKAKTTMKDPFPSERDSPKTSPAHMGDGGQSYSKEGGEGNRSEGGEGKSRQEGESNRRQGGEGIQRQGDECNNKRDGGRGNRREGGEIVSDEACGSQRTAERAGKAEGEGGEGGGAERGTEGRSKISARRGSKVGKSRELVRREVEEEGRKGEPALGPRPRRRSSELPSRRGSCGKEVDRERFRASADKRRQSRDASREGKERGTEGEGGTLFEDNEEDDVVDESHDRISALRSKLALALRGRQKELTQMLCSLCIRPLALPHRLATCRHVLCGVCHERTVLYFRECPVCCKEMSGPAHADHHHAQVMRMRLATLRTPPVIVSTEKARLEAMVRERERSNRLVLQFGWEEGGGEGGGEWIFFIGVVLWEGKQVLQGALCPVCLDGCEAVDHVTLQCPHGEWALLTKPNREGLGFTLTSSSRRCHMTVHWASSFWMAPLQVRTSAAGGSVRRRIAIQLPPDVTANTAKTAKAVGRRGSSDQGGEPLLYGDETAICSGWVSYSPGLSGGRAQGTVMLSSPSSRKVGEVKDAELAGRWIERLAEETEEGVEAAMGVVRDVQAALLDGASKLLPLREVAGWVEGTAHREVAGKLLFQSACLAVDPTIVDVYHSISEFVQFDPKGSRLLEILSEKDKGTLRLKHFYQVAIDLPGFGQTEASKTHPGFCPPSLLGEVVRSLAKQHAFAIVGHGHGAAAVLSALLELPKLASFVIVREPEIEQINVDTLHGILHPTLAVCDLHSPLFKSVRQLTSIFLQIRVPKFSLSDRPTYYHKDLALEMYALFDSNGWQGSQPSNGNSKKLPLLTRLAGGISAWRGVREHPQLLLSNSPKSPSGAQTVARSPNTSKEADSIGSSGKELLPTNELKKEPPMSSRRPSISRSSSLKHMVQPRCARSEDVKEENAAQPAPARRSVARASSEKTLSVMSVKITGIRRSTSGKELFRTSEARLIGSVNSKNAAGTGADGSLSKVRGEPS